MEIYKEKEQKEREKYKMYILRGKRITGKGKQIKEKLDVKWNKGSTDFRARPHQSNLLICEKKLKWKLIKESLKDRCCSTQL